ncbi:DODA-type extradiol aromatic ring-opening family dioxygenase [Chondromyces apiculatus]|uniref:Extradiol ring-cleavage dioxygenase, class III enzyme, subunit B n=1 Tax=Chondromyces apiculatus DSM 436 TaxID=1192034 RepID=A0A017T9A4_9BACT|nr:class III extradiol ring-cleavage dioxygenase [Chondromyces apiculatus]EYF05507.1 Extradiol ring-cleavage dioxygenase, class III enzyme, subunit B [Chondromyces apiculatus DSM 436]
MSPEPEEGLTRRRALVAGLAGAATLVTLQSLDGEPAQAGANGSSPRPATPGRLPVAFVPHGGGPWPFVEMGLDRAEVDSLAGYLRSVVSLPKTPPKAVLVISAHWEEPVPTVMTATRPPLYYDYYGFPPDSYTLTWPAPGDPRLAARVRELLGAAGFQTAENAERGFDHGTFIPLKLTYPEASVPTVQLSLKKGLHPEEHLAMGRALAPLRDEGIFIIGSGMTYHNMRGFRDPRAIPHAEAFDAWLRDAVTLDPEARDRRLAEWSQAPAARLVHPREEHLLPLMVVAGAAGSDRGTTAYNATFMGLRLSAFHFSTGTAYGESGA